MTSDVDGAIVGIAGRQQGNITHAQLRRLGLSGNDIRRRVKLGLLYRVHRGVYSVGRPPATPREHAGAAVLACGDRAALGHFSAAAHLSAWEHWPPVFDVIAPTDRRRPGIRTHHVALAGQDLRHHLGIRVTSPARTALDCAPALTVMELRRLVNNLRVRRQSRLTDEQIADIVKRNPRHPGAKRVVRARSGPRRHARRVRLHRDPDHLVAARAPTRARGRATAANPRAAARYRGCVSEPYTSGRRVVRNGNSSSQSRR